MALFLFRLFLICTVFLAVVLPNSLQATTATCLVLCALSSISLIHKNGRLGKILLLYGVTLFVTFAYVLLGVVKGAPPVAAFQVITVYALSPLLWILVSAAMYSKMDIEVFPKWFVFLVAASSASVALFFYLFINYGADSVTFFIETANVNLNDAYVGATMSVYGSFIFLTGALFASPTVIKNLTARVFCLSSVLIVVFTSGRSALILSVFIGLSIFLVFRKVGRANRRGFGGEIAILSVFLLGLLAYLYFSSIDLDLIFKLFYDEVASGGGEERVEQGIALLKGTAETLGLGAGHGIGVDYVRSDEYPWRYELVWAATLYRVGVLGFLIYFLPVIFYFGRFFGFYRRQALSKMDIFLFGGFFCALVASNTNPYAEAFTFQWMYIVPFVFLMLKPKN